MKCIKRRANGIPANRKQQFLMVFKKALLLSYESNKGVFVIAIIMGLLHSASYTAFTLALERFFDAIRTGQSAGREIIMIHLATLVIVILFRELFNAAHNLCGSIMRDYSKYYNMHLIHDRIDDISAYDMEKRETLDKIEMAKRGAEACFPFIDNFLDFFDFYLPYFIFMCVYLYQIDCRMPFLIIVIFLPFLLNAFLKNRIFSKLEKTQLSLIRRKNALKKAMTDYACVKEIFLYDALDFFIKKFQNAQSNYHAANEKSERKSVLCELSMKMITLLGFCTVLLILVQGLLRGTITVGEFSAIYASLGIMFTMMEFTVYRDFSSSVKKMYMVNNFLSFLDMKEQKKEESAEKIDSIELRHAFFQYEPGKTVLKDINLRVDSTQTIAIVGENGAGKTTLSKVLMGLYPIEAGTMLVNNKEVEQEDSRKLLKRISAVFQSFVHYKMTARENIVISDGFKKIDTKLLLTAKRLGIPEALLNDRELLSKEFDGKELSGGQWQRLAIARGMYRESDILFLDEPTSAIDPVEEMRLYEIMRQVCKGKMAFIVTHRMGCAQLADRILVMKNGEIVGDGSHKELMESNETYKILYQEQARWYQ